MKLQITEDQISNAGAGVLKPAQLQGHIFDAAHSPEKATPTSLVFISNQDFLREALAGKAQGMIVLEKNYPQLKEQIPSSVSIWTTPNIQLAMSRILELFNKKLAARPQGVHPTAIIHPDAKVAASASIAPYAVIQQFAVIGENTKIGSHTVVEAYAEVGSDTYLHPHVVLGAFCKVGNHCTIAPHVTIGFDGFGFLPDGKTNHKIPQIGIVVIEDHVEIGAHCAIDRAALEQTIIRKGAKLDNFCHIAHNCEIGENALLAGAFKVAGSTKIGKNFISSGNVDVNGHIEICDNVILTARTGVTASITQAGMYGGYPHEPHKDNIKNMVSLSHLHKIRKNVQKIMKHLNIED